MSLSLLHDTSPNVLPAHLWCAPWALCVVFRHRSQPEMIDFSGENASTDDNRHQISRHLSFYFEILIDVFSPGLLWKVTCLFAFFPVDTSLKPSRGHSGEARLPPETTAERYL